MGNKIKQAVILSAGLGTRLRPLTDNIPKVMLKVDGKPLLGWHLEQFKKYGIRDFFINLHYLPDSIKNYLGGGEKFGVKIFYSYEPKILGTAGGVKQFEDKLDDVFFVMYGDMMSFVDYSKMAEAFFGLPASPRGERGEPEDVLGMMIVGRNNHPHDSDLVEVGDDLKFLKLHAKPHEYRELPDNFRTLDAGYIFRRRILDYVPAGKYYEIDRQLLPAVLNNGEKFYGYETKDYLYDIGTMERHEEVQEYVKRNRANV